MTRDDDSKRAILSRRARFVAAALASAGLAAMSCNKNEPETNPKPCLSVVPDPAWDAGAPQEVPPQVCLSPLPPPPPPDAALSPEKKEPS